MLFCNFVYLKNCFYENIKKLLEQFHKSEIITKISKFLSFKLQFFFFN